MCINISQIIKLRIIADFSHCIKENILMQTIFCSWKDTKYGVANITIEVQQKQNYRIL